MTGDLWNNGRSQHYNHYCHFDYHHHWNSRLSHIQPKIERTWFENGGVGRHQRMTQEGEPLENYRGEGARLTSKSSMRV